MLLDATDEELVALFRERVVMPRRGRFREILERARDAGLLDDDADIDVALTMLTGSWYASALTGRAPSPNWARRASALVWRSLGGGDPT